MPVRQALCGGDTLPALLCRSPRRRVPSPSFPPLASADHSRSIQHSILHSVHTGPLIGITVLGYWVNHSFSEGPPWNSFPMTQAQTLEVTEMWFSYGWRPDVQDRAVGRVGSSSWPWWSLSLLSFQVMTIPGIPTIHLPFLWISLPYLTFLLQNSVFK